MNTNPNFMLNLKNGNNEHYKYPYKRLYQKMVRCAESKKREVDITYEDFVKFTEKDSCEYCGNSVEWVKHGKKATRYNLDRRINTLGYTKENCVVCCKSCNFLKSDMDEPQFLDKVYRIYKNILE